MNGTIGGVSTIDLSDNARELHTKMIKNMDKALFTQVELQVITNIPLLSDLMIIIQELLDKNLVKLVKQNNELKFQAVDISEAAKKSTMSAEESLVYSYIEASGREGIWTKTIKARTNLHQHVVLKCLKSLESQRYVKSVKSVKYPTRKIYMLYNLQPSIDVTGGPWFTDSELDVEFINSLLTIVWRYISERTFPNGFKNFSTSSSALSASASASSGTITNNNNSSIQSSSSNKNCAQLYAPKVKNYSTIDEILEFISGAQVANVELTDNDMRSLCEVLVFDDKLEKIEYDCYKVTLQSVLQMTNNDVVENNSMEATNDEDEFSIFKYYNYLPPSTNDKEAIFFDEWTL